MTAVFFSCKFLMFLFFVQSDENNNSSSSSNNTSNGTSSTVNSIVLTYETVCVHRHTYFFPNFPISFPRIVLCVSEWVSSKVWRRVWFVSAIYNLYHVTLEMKIPHDFLPKSTRKIVFKFPSFFFDFICVGPSNLQLSIHLHTHTFL